MKTIHISVSSLRLAPLLFWSQSRVPALEGGVGMGFLVGRDGGEVGVGGGFHVEGGAAGGGGGVGPTGLGGGRRLRVGPATRDQQEGGKQTSQLGREHFQTEQDEQIHQGPCVHTSPQV